MPNNLPKLHLKLLRKEQFKKAAEAGSDLTGDETADATKKFSWTSSQNSSETATNEAEGIDHDIDR